MGTRIGASLSDTMKNTAPPRALRGQGFTGAAPPMPHAASISKRQPKEIRESALAGSTGYSRTEPAREKSERKTSEAYRPRNTARSTARSTANKQILNRGGLKADPGNNSLTESPEGLSA